MVSGVDPETMAILERVGLVELTLFSKRARSNGLAFLAGWVLALSIVGAVVRLWRAPARCRRVEHLLP